MRRLVADSRVDETMLACWLLTMAGGLIMIYSASSVLADSRFGSQFLFLRQQFIWVVLSLAVVYVIARLDLKRLAVYSVPGLLLTIQLLSLVFIMPARNGSHRWLFLGPLTVQPSELFKFLIIVYLSLSLSNPKRNLSEVKQLLFPYLPIIGVGLALILAQPDLGTCAVIAMTVLGLFYLAGARIKHLAIAILPPIGVAAAVVFILRYRSTVCCRTSRPFRTRWRAAIMSSRRR
jgi:cell division protein FtsW